jgi:hypothetical protein
MDGKEFEFAGIFGAVKSLRRTSVLAVVVPYGALYLSWMILRWGRPATVA